MLNIGDKLPLEIKVKNLNGRAVTLKQYLGQPLVIYFYPRDNTPGCTLEAKSFRNLASSIHRLGAKIIGVSKDSVLSHRKFKQQLDLNFELLSDEKHQLQEAFGVWQEKRMFSKSYMGTVRSTFITDVTGQIVKVFPRVKPEGHVHEVCLELKKIVKPDATVAKIACK